MTDDRLLTRRALLATGAIGLGGGVLGGTAVARNDPVRFNQRQQVTIEPGERTDANANASGYLQVDWKEWYNGSPVERQDEPTRRDTAQAGVLTLPKVLPGDSGRVTVGLSTGAPGEETTPPAVEVLFRLREEPGTRAENGRNEPEVKAGDRSDKVGELQEHLQFDIWYDTGIRVTNTPVYGYCDAEENLGDSTFLSGTLAELSTVGPDQGLGNETWQTLDADASNPVESGVCIGPDEGICLTIEWSVTGDPSNVNRIQTDSVRPILEFAAVQCS